MEEDVFPLFSPKTIANLQVSQVWFQLGHPCWNSTPDPPPFSYNPPYPPGLCFPAQYLVVWSAQRFLGGSYLAFHVTAMWAHLLLLPLLEVNRLCGPRQVHAWVSFTQAGTCTATMDKYGNGGHVRSARLQVQSLNQRVLVQTRSCGCFTPSQKLDLLLDVQPLLGSDGSCKALGSKADSFSLLFF